MLIIEDTELLVLELALEPVEIIEALEIGPELLKLGLVEVGIRIFEVKLGSAEVDVEREELEILLEDKLDEESEVEDIEVVEDEDVK